MSTSYRRSELLPIAEAIASALCPYVAEVIIAGSIRRHKMFCKDIEIVVKPHNMPTLFEDPTPDIAGLDRDIAQLIAGGLFRFDPDNKKDGPKYKRLLTDAPYEGAPPVAIDLFIAEERNYGNILAIRTGDSDFSKLLVTKEGHKVLTSDGLNHYGFMPAQFKQNEGFLCHRGDLSHVIDCPTEQSYFEAIGFTVVPDPKERNCAFKKK